MNPDDLNWVAGYRLTAQSSKGRTAAVFLHADDYIDSDEFLRARFLDAVSTIADNGETIDMDTFEVRPDVMVASPVVNP